MNTREMARRQELCQTLNMNFDEANELFSTETLSSMTMAKVNGGGVVLTVCAVVTAGCALYWVIKDVLSDGATKSNNEPESPSFTINYNKETGEYTTMDGTMVIDSVKTVNGQTRFYFSEPIKPTPTSTSGNN